MLKYCALLLLRFLFLESFIVLSLSILYYKYNFPLLTALSLAFCSAFFLGRLDHHFFPKPKKKYEPSPWTE